MDLGFPEPPQGPDDSSEQATANPYAPPAAIAKVEESSAVARPPYLDAAALEARGYALRECVLGVRDGAVLPKVCLLSGEPGTEPIKKTVWWNRRRIRFTAYLGGSGYRQHHTARAMYGMANVVAPFIGFLALPEGFWVAGLVPIPFFALFVFAGARINRMYEVLKPGQNSPHLLLKPKVAAALQAHIASDAPARITPDPLLR